MDEMAHDRLKKVTSATVLNSQAIGRGFREIKSIPVVIDYMELANSISLQHAAPNRLYGAYMIGDECV